MQRLRHRLQAGARGAVGREPAPRRHDQRRRPRRALDLGRLHALLRRAVHGGLPGRLLLQTEEGVVLHDKDLCIGCGYCFYACPFGAPQFPQAGAFGVRGKMDKCTFCAGGPEADNSRRGVRASTAATGWPKASCRPAPRCARPRRCSAAMAMCSPTSTATASSSAARARKSGAGARLYGPAPQQQPGQQPPRKN